MLSIMQSPSLSDESNEPTGSVDTAEYELADEELEAVAGGWYIVVAYTLVCFGDGNQPR